MHAYSGSRYPRVPAGIVAVCVLVPLLKALVRPKSDNFASRSEVSRMFPVFTSLWIKGGLQDLCRYSSPKCMNNFNLDDVYTIKTSMISSIKGIWYLDNSPHVKEKKKLAAYRRRSPMQS